jgi:hypothetical protein
MATVSTSEFWARDSTLKGTTKSASSVAEFAPTTAMTGRVRPNLGFQGSMRSVLMFRVGAAVEPLVPAMAIADGHVKTAVASAAPVIGTQSFVFLMLSSLASLDLVDAARRGGAIFGADLHGIISCGSLRSVSTSNSRRTCKWRRVFRTCSWGRSGMGCSCIVWT